MFIKGIVNDKVVDEVRTRMDRIDIDGMLESGYIEELIQDDAYTPFPTINNSERPDTVAGGLLEGRVAILVDGTPSCCSCPPCSRISSKRRRITTSARISLAAPYPALRLPVHRAARPSAYIAITTFHQEMIPTPLLISSRRSGRAFRSPRSSKRSDGNDVRDFAGSRAFACRGRSDRRSRSWERSSSARRRSTPDWSAGDGHRRVHHGHLQFRHSVVQHGHSDRMIRFLFMSWPRPSACSASWSDDRHGAASMQPAFVRRTVLGAVRAVYPEDQKDNIFRLPQWTILTRQTGQSQ